MKTFVLVCIALLFVAVSNAQETRPVKLKGQVVCSVCWFEAKDRKKTPYGNAADITCAEECSGNNIPQALGVVYD